MTPKLEKASSSHYFFYKFMLLSIFFGSHNARVNLIFGQSTRCAMFFGLNRCHRPQLPAKNTIKDLVPEQVEFDYFLEKELNSKGQQRKANSIKSQRGNKMRQVQKQNEQRTKGNTDLNMKGRAS